MDGKRREERSTGTENELVGHLVQVKGFHSMQIHSGAGVVREGFAAGRMDLPGRAEPGQGPAPRLLCCQARGWVV